MHIVLYCTLSFLMSVHLFLCLSICLIFHQQIHSYIQFVLVSQLLDQRHILNKFWGVEKFILGGEFAPGRAPPDYKKSHAKII